MLTERISFSTPEGWTRHLSPNDAMKFLKSKVAHPRESFWNVGSGGMWIKNKEMLLTIQPVNLDVRSLWIEIESVKIIGTKYTLCNSIFDEKTSYDHFNKGMHYFDLYVPACYKADPNLAWTAVEYFLRHGATNPELIWDTRDLVRVPNDE